jgi:hypothetical protein
VAKEVSACGDTHSVMVPSAFQSASIVRMDFADGTIKDGFDGLKQLSESAVSRDRFISFR